MTGSEQFTATELLDRTGAPASVRWEIGGAGFDELVSLYTDAGFLYAAKAAALAGHLPAIRDSWERTLRAGTALHWTANARDERGRLEASVSTWRSTLHGWVGQHLASRGRPRLAGAVLLLAQRTMIDLGSAQSHQYWFQPANRFASRTFGSAAQVLPERQTGLRDTAVCALPPAAAMLESAGVRVTECGPHDSELIDFARVAVGDAFAAAEDLADGDTGLAGIDEIYRRVGLRRQRRVWLAYLSGAAEPCAALLAYQGPLGLNFSFLENRSEILLAPWLGPAGMVSVTYALTGLAARLTGSFAAAEAPLVVPPEAVPAIEDLGGRLLRSYRQVICVEAGFTGWYEHMARFYQRIAGPGGHEAAGQVGRSPVGAAS